MKSIIKIIAILLLASCASKFDPQQSYYRSYCFYPREAAPDQDTYNYWRQLCQMYGEPDIR